MDIGSARGAGRLAGGDGVYLAIMLLLIKAVANSELFLTKINLLCHPKGIAMRLDHIVDIL